MKPADCVSMTDSLILQNKTVPYRLKEIINVSIATAG